MTALVLLVLWGLVIFALVKAPGEAIQAALAWVWMLMGLWALGSIAWAVLSR